MKKYKATWYDQNSIVLEDPEPIEAESETEAVDKAYVRHGGNPPAPLLSLVEIK